jgi:hypothetical protein
VSCGDPTLALRVLEFKSLTSRSDGLAVTLDHLARGARATA